ncbi:MAG: restriction endonuclease subunit S, partial [Nitrospira sp.]|nr:restriction endonuclease subunit S [Nitrospira sp.]
ACAAISVDDQKALADFVKIRLAENYEETRKAAVGGAQPNLNLGKVREIGISLPGLEEQSVIVDKVAQLLMFEKQIEKAVVGGSSRVESLTQSILAKAFRGELVPQNPDDEPASVLLERIRGGRGARKRAEHCIQSS